MLSLYVTMPRNMFTSGGRGGGTVQCPLWTDDHTHL